MVRNGEMSVADVKRVLRRYWWILPITTFFLGAIGLGAALVLPKKFTSETMILVEQPSVGADYVKPVVTDMSRLTRAPLLTIRPLFAKLTAMLPGMFCYALLQYGLSPIFQIGKRTAPMIVSALSACLVEGLALLVFPRGADGYWLALAQSGALFVGLIVSFLLAAATKPVWPSGLDILSTLVATAAMVVVVLPLRSLAPGPAVLAAQAILGIVLYGGAAYILDIARVRSRIAAGQIPGLRLLVKKAARV